MLRLTPKIKQAIIDNAMARWEKRYPFPKRKPFSEELYRTYPQRDVKSENRLYFAQYKEESEKIKDWEQRRYHYEHGLSMCLLSYVSVEKMLEDWPEIAPLLEGIPLKPREQFKLVL